MTDVRTAAVLQEVLRRESHSLMQYVSEAFPWATAEERQALAEVRKMIGAEQRAAAELGRFMVRNRVPLPYLGAYPDYTGINFVTLDHLLPLLAAEEKKGIARLGQDLAAVTDLEARALLEKIASTKKQHLHTLEALAAPHPEKVAVHQP